MTGYRTGIGTSTADRITLLGHDLAADLIGRIGFGELAYWLIVKCRPTPSQLAVFEAVLVALADHGFTPTALAARLTLYSAPDSLQGAVAAGLLGGGSRFLGVTEDTGRFLAERLADRELPAPDDLEGWDAEAIAAVQLARERGMLVPGLGHPVHRVRDPRIDALLSVAEDAGQVGPATRLLLAIERSHDAVLGRRLPLNGAGLAGALLVDAGIPIVVLRGVALLARIAGLLGHLEEELRDPVAPAIYAHVDRNAVNPTETES